MKNKTSVDYNKTSKLVEPIDFVITYVDDADPEWLKKRSNYVGSNSFLNKNYRSWDNLHYWFRCVDKYAPWVNKIFLVTDNQVPRWLDINNEKIVVVNHEDFIPKEYLPVFSSHPIELNLHRIEELGERFVYFNDDTFITANVEPTYFFVDGLPCDYPVESPFKAVDNTFSHICTNNIMAINREYDRKKALKTFSRKFYSNAYIKGKLKNLYFSAFNTNSFFGFEDLHLASCMLKTAFDNVWNEYYDELNNTCSHRFRDDTDVNQRIITYWMYVNGLFHPYNWRNSSKSYQLNDSESKENNINEAIASIIDDNTKLVCINDANVNNFDKTKAAINRAFDTIVHGSCKYEKLTSIKER